MECNKDEAERCKSISEAALKKLDLVAAKRFALKAKQLFPELDGVAQLSCVIDVFSAAQQKLRNGEANWYAILQVDFRADENTIRKQYRKLALFLHPDKNKIFGAESAFKNISEAWSVLSDGKKKSDYDKRWFAYMAALRMRSPQSPFRARGNGSNQQTPASQAQQRTQKSQLNKQASQGLPRHMPLRQGLRAQLQGPIHGNANQQQWKGYALANKQQEPIYREQGDRQDQGYANAHQQQSPYLAKFHARECAQQGESQGQGQPYPQQCESPMHDRQEEFTNQNQGQDCVQGNQLPSQGQSIAHQQRIDVHTQKQQQGEACRLRPGQSEELIRKTVNGQVHAHHQEPNQSNSHQQQQQQHQHLRERGHTFGSQQQELHTQDRLQDDGEVCSNLPQGQVKTHALEKGSGEVHTCLQGQNLECVPERDQGQEDHHKHQGQTETPQSHGKLKEASSTNTAFPHKKLPFWTACPYCKMQFEYEQAYMNKKLCCPMCSRPFFSKEILPLQGAIIWHRPMYQHKEITEEKARKKNFLVNFSDLMPEADLDNADTLHSDWKAKKDQEDKFSGMKMFNTLEVAHSAEKGKIQEQQFQIGTCNRAGVSKIRSGVTDEVNLSTLISERNAIGTEKQLPASSMSFIQNKAPVLGQTARQGCFNERSSNTDEHSSRLDNTDLAQTAENRDTFANTNEDNSRVRTRNFVKANHAGGLQRDALFAELGSSKLKVSEPKRKAESSLTEAVEDFATASKRLRGMSNQIESAFKSDNNQLLKCMKTSDNNFLSLCITDGVSKEFEMEVPDSDFYDFDKDRTEKHFSVGQIWATYDDDDGMPRYYARVNKILSISPFRLLMNWLEARNPTDETQRWLGAGFQHICGDFMLGTIYIADQISTFSHRMTVDKVSKGHYKIYPRKGDVWAVYKGWEFLKVRDDHRGYEMVAIVATFDEKRGVGIATLLKVTGFKTIFEARPGTEFTKWIPSHELTRFSHQVPARLLEFGKIPNVQGKCLELDPASTPMNLITGVKEELKT